MTRRVSAVIVAVLAFLSYRAVVLGAQTRTVTAGGSPGYEMLDARGVLQPSASLKVREPNYCVLVTTRGRQYPSNVIRYSITGKALWDGGSYTHGSGISADASTFSFSAHSAGTVSSLQIPVNSTSTFSFDTGVLSPGRFSHLKSDPLRSSPPITETQPYQPFSFGSVTAGNLSTPRFSHLGTLLANPQIPATAPGFPVTRFSHFAGYLSPAAFIFHSSIPTTPAPPVAHIPDQARYSHASFAENSPLEVFSFGMNVPNTAKPDFSQPAATASPPSYSFASQGLPAWFRHAASIPELPREIRTSATISATQPPAISASLPYFSHGRFVADFVQQNIPQAIDAAKGVSFFSHSGRGVDPVLILACNAQAFTVGETIRLTIAVSNLPFAEATQSVVFMRLPPARSPWVLDNGVSGVAIDSDNHLIWNLDRAPGNSGTYEITIHTIADLESGRD